MLAKEMIDAAESARPIIVFGDRAGQGSARCRQFEIYNARILLTPCDEVTDDDAGFAAVVDSVFDATHDVRSVIVNAAERVRVAERNERQARSELEDMRARLPVEPSMLLGVGCVRWCDGQMWMLSKRETGWAASGFRVDGWDEVFRRWRAEVVDVGTDKHGPYVLVGPKAVP